MEHRNGFSLYGVVFIFGFFSLLVAMYFINVRAKEFVYYKELARQRNVQVPELIPCGGKNNIEFGEGYSCKISKPEKEAIGHCVKSL